eukprot:SAG25_NODE_14978_length_192_cov_549.634409_1_plen_50_part_10
MQKVRCSSWRRSIVSPRCWHSIEETDVGAEAVYCRRWWLAALGCANLDTC